jgi:hypothetical protein
MKKHPALIVLKALLEGHRVKGLLESAPEYELVVVEDYQQRRSLCTYATKEQLGSGKAPEPVLIRMPLYMDDFLQLCEKYPEEKIAELTANIALNHSKG